jgi:hypothetical protein
MILCIAALLVVLVSCKKETTTETPAKSIEDYLTKSNEITGWAAGATQWTANNITELTVYIDGAAEIYRKYGFIEAAHREFTGTVNGNPASVKLDVYNHGSTANAQSLYADPDLGFNGALVWTGGAGNAAHYLRNGGLSQQMAFIRNGFYISLEMSADTEESLNVLKQFALNVDAKVK